MNPPAPRPMPSAEEPHHEIAGHSVGPATAWLARSVKPKGESGMPSDKQFKESARWGVPGILALGAVFVIGAIVWKWGPPTVSAGDAPDRWSSADQSRFEMALSSRLDKMDRVIERLDTLILAQAKTTDRILTMLERQDDRIRALENARK